MTEQRATDLQGPTTDETHVAERPGPRSPVATLVVTALVVVATFGFFLSARRVRGTDDYTFGKATARWDSVMGWVGHRYETWSGRLVPEAAIYVYTSAPLIWWQLTSAVLFLAFVAMLVAYHRLLHPSTAVRALAPVIGMAAVLLFLMGSGSLRGGVIWVTGAMNYFWVVPFALVGMYPVAHVYARGRRPRWWVTAGAVVAAAVAAVSAEQIGAVMLVLVVIAVVDRAVVSQRTGTPDRADVGAVAMVMLATAVGFVALMAAPGNDLRTEIDAATWLPDYFETPFAQRLDYGLRFVVHGLVNSTGLVLPALWASLLVVLARRPRQDRWDVAAAAALVAALAVSSARFVDGGSAVFNLHYGWKVPLEGVSSVLVLVLWIVILTATAVAPLIAFRDRLGATFSLLVLGAYASLAAITLSPSMYASGPRVIFIPATILLLVVFGVYFIAFRTGERLTRWVVLATAVPAVIQAARLVDLMLNRAAVSF